MNASLQRHAGLIAVSLLCIAALLPFINKPFHLDDPMYIWAARHIRTDPLDFYGFNVNWSVTAVPMHEVMKNPPLASYYIAAVTAIFGESEVVLHAAFIAVALSAVAGTYRLAELLCPEPELAAAATLFAPVFLLSASTVMCDVMMLLFWIWAVVCWIKGMRDGRRVMFVAAGVLAALSSMSKYFGVAVIPLLLVHGLAQRRWRLGRWTLALLIPAAALTAYQLWTQKFYGRGLLLDAAGYATSYRTSAGSTALPRIVSALAFVGGGCASVVMLHLVRSRRALITFAWLAPTCAAALLIADPFRQHRIHHADGLRWGLWIQASLFVTGGLILAQAALAQVRWRKLDADSVLVGLWFFGTLLFSSLLNWSVNGRSVLPLAPIGAIAVLRASASGTRLSTRRWQWAALGPAAALALLCTWADMSLARTARTAAERIHLKLDNPQNSIWFSGHWGFQWYIQGRGGKPIDVLTTRLRTGDRVIFPSNNSSPIELPEDLLAPDDDVELQPTRFVAIMSRDNHAGFYSDVWGPLPFAFGAVPPERYAQFRVIRGVALSDLME